MKKIFIPPVFFFLSTLTIVLFYFLLREYNFVKFPYNLSGILLLFAGFSLMGKTRELFNKHKTTLFFEKSSCIVDEGIFSKTRNPMYCGMFLGLMGIAICFQNVFSLIVPFLFLAIIRFFFIPLEEKMMTETFGQQYIDYIKRTRRWF